MHEQLSSSNELHDEENLLVCLEDVLHTNKEWMIGLEQYIFLEKGTLNLVVVKDNILSKTLHSVNCFV